MAGGMFSSRGPAGNNGVNTKIEKAKDVRYTIKRLMNYLSRYSLWLIFAIILTIGSSMFSLIGPELSGNAIDAIELGKGNVDINKVLYYVILMISFYLISAVLSYILSLIMVHVAKKIVYEMRKDAFDKLMKAPVSYFDNHQIGDIISVISYDVDTVNTSLSSDVVSLVSSAFTIVISLIMMLKISPILVLVFVVTIPCSILYSRVLVKKTRKLYTKRSRALGELNGFSEEMITGNKSIKSYSQNENVYKKYEKINKKATDAYYVADYYGCLMGPGVNFFNNLSLSLVCVGGALLNIFTGFSYGNIAKFVQYSRKFSGPINEIANLFADLQSSLAAAERVFSLIDEKTELEDKIDALSLERVEGNISFDHVVFGYDENKMIIKDLTLDVNKGEQIAIVGPTGAGKTTIVNLLMRFYDVNDGNIYLDGNSIYDIKRKELRNTYAMVLQDTWLFEGSVYDNVAYGSPNATMESVVEACKLSHIHDFIVSLPDGYNTILVDGGTSISKGQKQLLTIARAMLLDARVLILDEATSNVDTRTETKIQDAMINLMEGKTSFIIAHRLSTIRNANKIIVIDDGRIVESGNHQELMDKKQVYYQLYNSQFD